MDLKTKMIIRSCLFTKQKEKKRKNWSDGVIKITPHGSCSLFSADSNKLNDKMLESKYLTAGEMNKVKMLQRGEELEIEFENFIVQVESYVSEGKHF